MIRGIWAAIRGMSFEQARVDTVANNVANVDTNGYKRKAAVGTEFSAMLVSTQGVPGSADPAKVGEVSGGPVVDQLVTSYAQGDVVPTGNPLDVAIQGPGWFTYQGLNGPGYTRAGNFRRDDQGILTTAEGFPLLVGGAPVGAGAGEIAILDGGQVVADGTPVGLLDIQGGDNSTLVLAKNLERSNVDLTQEMTDMIVAMRSFQANQRSLSVQDATLSKAVNEIAKV